MVDANQGKWMRRRDTSIVVSIILIAFGLIEAIVVISGLLFLIADVLIVIVGLVSVFLLHQRTSKTSIREMVKGLRVFSALILVVLVITIGVIATQPAGQMIGDEILAVMLLIIALVNSFI